MLREMAGVRAFDELAARARATRRLEVYKPYLVAPGGGGASFVDMPDGAILALPGDAEHPVMRGAPDARNRMLVRRGPGGRVSYDVEVAGAEKPMRQ